MNTKRLPLLLVVSTNLILFTACGGSNPGGGGGGVGPATHFSVNGPIFSPSGNTFTFTATALSASNKPVANYSGVVHFSSTDLRAQLPPDSTLSSGTKTFSAALTTAGNQTVTATDTSTASIAGTSPSINVGALASVFPVEVFGARGDGVTDDTGAIQSAIAAAAAAGGGSVMFKVARYYTTGNFLVPEGVMLCGAVQGPFDVIGVDPAVTTIAPTLLITNTASPFITLDGDGTGLSDLLFHYPNQVHTSASTPTVYPYTIRVNRGMKVVRSTVTNAYNFLDIELGRFAAQNLFIGAFNTAVNIDHSYDFVTLHDLRVGILWDEMETVNYPSPIDNWVLNHGTGLIVNQMDALEVDDFYVFSRAVGINLTFSSDLTEPGIRTSWGTGSDIDLEMVQYGIISDATNQPGFEFTNVQMRAAPGMGQAAVQLKGGGTNPPDIIVNGASARGPWALGAFPAPAAGHLTILNMI